MEGIIFEGFLLSKEEFKEIYKSEVGKKIIEQLNQKLEELFKDIENGLTAGEIFYRWDKIQREFFFPTTILGVQVPSPDETEKNQSYIFSANQEEIGVLEGSKLIASKLVENEMAEEVSKTLQKHYLGMIRSLKSSNMSKKEAKKYHIYLYYLERKANQKNKPVLSQKLKTHYTGQPYSTIYGNLSYSTKEGKQLDAFMNHIGNLHAEIFNNTKEVSIAAAKQLAVMHKTVAQEEGKNFFDLILSSMNTTPWFASGDILIVNEQGQIVYNIQLKSFQSGGGQFNIKKTRLKNSIINIINIYKEGNLDKAAEIMFNALKTSSSNNPEPRSEDYIKWVEQEIQKKIPLIEINL